MIALPETLPALAAVVAAFTGAAILLLARHRRQYTSRICRRWGLHPGEVAVLSSDLGRHRLNRRLLAADLVGPPDVLFRDRRSRQIVVGEARSRQVTACERYQMLLCCGMARRLYRRSVRAITLRQWHAFPAGVAGMEDRLAPPLATCARALQGRLRS